jgi:hypothetical protein
VASNSLGRLNIRYDPSLPTLFSFEVLDEPLGDSSRGGAHGYLLLSLLLSFSAFAGVMPVRSLLPRLLFVAIFTFVSAKSLEQITFPDTVSETVVTVDGGLFGLPWLSCLALSFFGTSTVLNAAVSVPGSSGQWMTALLVACPFLSLVWIAIEQADHYLAPLCFASSLTHIVVAACSRVLEFSRQHDPVYLANSAAAKSSVPFTESVCVISSCVGFLFGAIACWFSRHLVLFDFALPLLSLVFYTTGDGNVIPSTPALGVVAIVSSLWWIVSAIYSLFLKGHDGLQFLQQFRSSSTPFLLDDVDASIWNGDDEVAFRWITVLHIGLLLVALPGIILSFLRRRNESEDLMFVLAVVSLLSAILSQIWSIRLLGVVSALYAAWRCYDIGRNIRKGDQTI